MKPYSNDLREKIIKSVEKGELSQAKIAVLFGVSKSFVEKLLARWRQTGSFQSLPHGGGRTRKLAAFETEIRAAVADQPDITLAELEARLVADGSAPVSSATMCNELNRLGLGRKKKSALG